MDHFSQPLFNYYAQLQQMGYVNETKDRKKERQGERKREREKDRQRERETQCLDLAQIQEAALLLIISFWC